MNTSDIIAQQLRITGLVQGVGFRPFIYRLATKYKLDGSIKDCGLHVNVLVQGDRENIISFLNDIRHKHPPLVNIETLVKEDAKVNPAINLFVIEKSSCYENVKISQLKDYAVCDDCLDEFNDIDNRRFHYAFISCTNCGPRYSILRNFPVDRKNTSFSKFTPCSECQDEYEDAGNRRFHAQNISCPMCGPKLTYTAGDIHHCVNRLLAGEIVCIKGVGGYRLYCDAMSEVAVAKLRDLKQRPDKPFAIIYPDKDNLRLLKTDLFLSDENHIFLRKTTRAILLIQQKHASTLVKSIAPRLSTIGVMLPATGFEHLLLNTIDRPLVATSANLSGGPIITEAEMAERKLSKIANVFVHHDLDIQYGLDDSVFKSNRPNNIIPIRLGRSYAPCEYQLPFMLDEPILALGAQNKNTMTIAWQDRAIVSPHLGDMNNLEVWEKSQAQIKTFQQMLGIKTNRYLVDAHPAYTANQWVKNSKHIYNELLHHHAHASALFFEHQCKTPLLVFTWDGTGYGDNGMLWGGEAFYGSPGGWSHVSSVRPFKLPGGEIAIKEPWRIAASLCWQVDQEYTGNQLNAENLRALWRTDVNCPLSSSVGRLFDAAAVFLGLLDVVSYDGQAAMQLETIAIDDTIDFIVPKIRGEKFDWQPLLALLQDSSLAVSYRAKVFHNSLAHLILQQTVFLSEKYVFDHVGLTGGVFQNSLLNNLAKELLNKQGYHVLFNETLPANDAAISLGQVMEYGMSKFS